MTLLSDLTDENVDHMMLEDYRIFDLLNQNRSNYLALTLKEWFEEIKFDISQEPLVDLSSIEWEQGLRNLKSHVETGYSSWTTWSKINWGTSTNSRFKFDDHLSNDIYKISFNTSSQLNDRFLKEFARYCHYPICYVYHDKIETFPTGYLIDENDKCVKSHEFFESSSIKTQQDLMTCNQILNLIKNDNVEDNKILKKYQNILNRYKPILTDYYIEEIRGNERLIIERAMDFKESKELLTLRIDRRLIKPDSINIYRRQVFLDENNNKIEKSYLIL